ncbi:putative protein-synthesizing GTPase [Helianthus annuus]|uniref:Uncharacterized protein n=2 Tax=Helianthus annuus TaxID=4232 RepID=A0A9K3JZ02_HELAN|nr:putative protein-synthesizing GTPase [Helianthus annuus]KAJ0624568.1 putative protein-synthesizing GTPase [Helianthus annuus]KAJ0628309.1 putative protein-synthesizing GTPase [Helianthus annuus]KAJ0793836.1 putative protein-synthesizing GTPase [Helianthus annuus]KAJ0949652.1 putative protein-synthesizing GTPase [Helianthus annuus]
MNPDYGDCKFCLKLKDHSENRCEFSEVIAKCQEWVASLKGRMPEDVLIQCQTGSFMLSGNQTMVVIVGMEGSGKSSIISGLNGRGVILKNEEMHRDFKCKYVTLRTNEKKAMTFSFIEPRGVENMLTGLSIADCAIIVIDSTQGYPINNIVDSEDNIVDPASLAVSMGLKTLICCVNKMDVVGYSQTVYNQLRDGAITYFKSIGIEESNVTFVPVSAQTGDGLLDKSEEMAWYEGLTLIGQLHTLDRESRTSRRLRLVVDSTEVKGTVVLIRCRVHYGILLSGRRVVFCPGNWAVYVDKMRVGGLEVKYAWPGEAVELEVKGPVNEMMEQGCVGAAIIDDKLKVAMGIEVEILVTNSKVEVTTGLQGYLCSCHKASFPVIVSQIKESVDAATRIRNKDTPTSLKIGQIGVVSLTPLVEVVVETVSDYMSLGRIIFCKEEEEKKDVVAVGVVVDVDHTELPKLNMEQLNLGKPVRIK